MQQSDIPPPLAWEQRAKGINSMPGGYSGYLDSLRHICGHVEGARPSQTELTRWIQDYFNITQGSSNTKMSLMRKAGIIDFASSRLRLTEHASRWYTTGDDNIIVALLHSRVQFIGEILAELQKDSKSTKELWTLAEHYGLSWNTRGQIDRRRGWLESSKLIEKVDKGRLAITDKGRNLLSRLEVHTPADTPDPESPAPAPPSPVTPHRAESDDAAPPSAHDTSHAHDPPTEPGNATLTPDPDTSDAQYLANEIREAATDSGHPDRLEVAVRDAFRFLGFAAERLGGPGKTDVLVNAAMGKVDSYSIAVDAKTVGSGSLSDQQVDWVTLTDHRRQHRAKYSAVVGPNPRGGRLMDRATQHQVALLSAERLADLCLQHAETPLGLADYELLFRSGGEVDTSPIDAAAKDAARLRRLAAAVCATLGEQASALGWLTARDLLVLLMKHSELGANITEQEIQEVLDTLASPLVGAVRGDDPSRGYVLATRPEVSRLRLELLGRELTGES